MRGIPRPAPPPPPAAGRRAVDGSKSGRYVAPTGAIAAARWNRREVEVPMINPQHGALPTVAPARGGSAIARRRE